MTDVWLTLGIFLVEIVLAVRLLQIGYGSYKAEIVYQRGEGVSGFVLPSGGVVALGIVGLFILGGAGIITYDILTISTDIDTIGASGILPQEIGNVAMDIYADIFGTQELTTVEWGTVEPGSSTVKTAYVRNSGGDWFTADITTINWLIDGDIPEATDNWGGSETDYFVVTWDFGDSSMSPGRQREVEISLWVSGSVSDIETFSFDIVITATEA